MLVFSNNIEKFTVHLLRTNPIPFPIKLKVYYYFYDKNMKVSYLVLCVVKTELEKEIKLSNSVLNS